jgi:hypothetical protein
MEPGGCFVNCLRAVLQDNYPGRVSYDLRYVLVWVINPPDAAPRLHAILRIGGSYFDPTLELAGLHTTSRYEYIAEFDFTEISARMGEDFDDAAISGMATTGTRVWPRLIVSPEGFGFNDTLKHIEPDYPCEGRRINGKPHMLGLNAVAL